jgi:hypothetical protein
MYNLPDDALDNIGGESAHLSPQFQKHAQAILAEIDFTDDVRTAIAAALSVEQAQLRSLELDRRLLNAEITSLMTAAEMGDGAGCGPANRACLTCVSGMA